MPRASRLVLTSLMMFVPARADALCLYRGVDNARTTIRQEYVDALWVVRARVISANDGEFEAGSPDAGMRWTLYRLHVVHAYKGRPPQRFTFFTGRNSGGFYMDRPWVPLPSGHDIGGEYLLFLVPDPRRRTNPPAARLAMWVNYNCGQSKPWAEVTRAEVRRLETLSRRR